MNLTKKSKLTALITVTVMCLAIIITAGVIFVPKIYNRSDTDLVATVDDELSGLSSENSYGMKAPVFSGSNMKAVKYTGVENGGASILYPSIIYMDVTETLESLGYYFFVDAYYTSCSQNPGIAILYNVFGYYSKIPYNTSNGNAQYFSNDSEYYALMRVFGDSQNSYRISDHKGIDNCYEIENGSKSYTKNNIYIDNSMKVFVPKSKGSHVTGTIQISGKPDASYISSQKKDTYKYTNTTSNVLFAFQRWRTINAWRDDVANSHIFNFDNASGAVTLNGIATNYTSSMDISLNIYDKAPLLKVMKELDAKYNALLNTTLLLGGEDNRYNKLKSEVVTLLQTREVTQSQLDAKQKEVEDYVFKTCIGDPNLGSQDSPKTEPYGTTYGLHHFWMGYNNPISSTNTTLSSCFPAGAMNYYPNGYKSGGTPVTGDKNQLTQAGYYDVTFAPDTSTKTISVGGQYVDVSFSWSDGTTSSKTAYLWIKPSTINITGSFPSPLELKYNGNTPNTLTDLPSGIKISVTNFGGSNNTPTVQLSTVKRDDDVASWLGVGNTVSFPDVTDDVQTVYYRVSASNHFDVYSSFTVKVLPADISVKLKHFEQEFHSDLLDSANIFKEMLDESTPNILDAESFEETKAYLQDILSFVILKNDEAGYFNPAVDKPNAGSYTIDCQKSDEWAKRIGNITLVGSSNAYQITPIYFDVEWNDNVNKWYDNARGHRPTAKIAEDMDTFGQTVGLTSVDVAGDKGTPLDDSGNAVNAGTYTAKVSSTNSNFAVANSTYEFTIYPRKITVDIQDRETVYAAGGDIDTQSAQYYNVILKNNTNNEAYVATLDSEIATATGQTSALVHNDYNDVFTVNIKPFEPNGTAGNYYAAGDHTLEFVSLNSNYEITGIDGKFTVLPAKLTVSIQQLPPKVYNAETQDIILELTPGADGNVVLYGYELEHFDECVKIEYSATGHDGSWSETPLTITNVIESPKTVYYKVSAPNHTYYTGTFTEEMTAVNIMVYFDGQKDTVYYGSEIPTSDQLLTICNHRFTVSEKLVDEGGGISSEDIKDIHPSAIFDFYLLDPKTGQAVVNRNADAGSYTVTHRLKAGVSEDINNFNVIYHLDETTGVRDNVNAYTISPKPLQVVWEQSGDRWTGEGKDHYIFNNIIPTVFPTAPNSYDGKENVVTGDSIYLAGIELGGSRVNAEGYTVTTKLTTDRNQRNYVLVDDEHTFYIDPLEVKIVIKDQYAKYGQARQIPLGELIDPISVGAIWDYAQGSEARFFSDHYSNYKFISQAHSTDGSALVDVGEYSIEITANTKDGMDGTIRDNYKVTVVTTEEGKSGTFHITPADIHFTGRQYNIAYDLKEDTVLTKNALIDRISTGLEDRGVDASQFTVLMSERFLQTNTSINEDNATWVDATAEVTKDIDCARYYVLLKVTHPQGNFNPFVAKVELNILSNWVSVIIGKGVTDAEYGYTVFPSEKIFDKLDIVSIAGFMTESGEQLWNTNQDEAKNLLKQYVQLYVGLGDLKTEMEKNASVGDYSIYMRVIKTGEYENFRFLPREGESDTSNINAYHVGPRTITVTWGEMDEEYGDHGNSHTGYTIVGIVPGEEELVRLELTHDVDKEVERNTARFEGGHAFAAGYYVAQVVGVSNPNYTIDPDDKNLTTTFVIKPKEIEIDLHDRTFVYGVENARIDKINEALNVYSQTPNYDVVSKSPFVGSDKRDSIFEIYFDGSIADGLNYLPVGEYVINARQVFTTVSVNYQVTVRNIGKLKIDKASAGLSVKQLTTLYFNADDQEVRIDRDWLVLSGDADVIRENAAVSYKFVSREDYRDTTTTEYTPEGEYTVRDSGRYVISVQIEADNHETYVTDVNLNVTPANVIINMSQAEKTYGDTLADMIKKAEQEDVKGITSLSDWLKVKCGITIEMYRDFGGGNRPQWDITEYALRDFEFYVVDPNNVSGDGGGELQPGSYQNNVGEYRVYHRMASGALASNYIVEYYQEPGVSSKCNAHAYKIIPRPVDVIWDVTDKVDWNTNHTQYYYTGHTPGLVAMFYALADESGQQPSVRLQIEGMENVNVNADGGHYTAKVVHSNWESNQYATNYTLREDAYEYSIVKRPIRVTINDQYKGVYGSVNGGVEVSPGEFSIYDIKANKYIDTLPVNPIELVLENVGLGEDKLLPAGSYKISGICHNDNYEVTFVGKDGGECGWLIVDKAQFSYAHTSEYSAAKYLGKEFTLNFKDILSVNADAFVAGDDWESAWKNAKITYIQNGVTVASPVFTGAGLHSVQFTLTFDNYNDFTGTLNVNVQKATVNVSVNAVYSYYGDALLDSDKIFEGGVTLAKGSDEIEIAISDIITLYVDSSAVNAGKYVIEFRYVGDEENNFDVHLIDNSNKYEIKPRVVKIIWELDENDSYVFDNKPHKIICDIDNVVNGDNLTPRFEEYNQKSQAGTYVARLISIGDNGNYAMPEDCSFEWTIKPRAIQVSWTVGDYTYDGESKVPTARLNPDDVLDGTSCGIKVTGAGVNAGDYVAVAEPTSSNYTFIGAEQAFTIKPRQIQVIWGDDTFVYDGQLHAPTASVKDGELLEGDKVGEIKVDGAQKNAGSYTATVVGLDNSNYVVVGANKSFVIEKKVVTIQWTDTDFDYTGEEIAPYASVNIGDIVSGDSVVVEISGGKVDVGTYTATAIGVSNGNYVLAPNSVKEMEYTINKVNNEFDGLFGKGDSKNDIVGIPWAGEDKPTNKFGGEVIIKYYDDADCTKEVDVNKIKDGTYWAVAFVAGTDNYNELVSSPLKFTIDNGINIGLAVSGIVISVLLLGAVLTIILVVNKKRKGGNA